MKRKKFGIHFMIRMAVAAVVVFVIGKTTLSSYALIDGTNAVHISSSRIENSTLIIGSHLIYLEAMNDQIYELALRSADRSNQHKRYYKSEVSDGTWYDITEADSMSDITAEGKAVPDSEIEALYFTHHTKSDGLTYYLKKNTAVCIFDIEDPYDLENMDELADIKRRYDSMVQVKEPSETMKRDLSYLKEIYKIERENEVTKEADKKIDALYTYYKNLLKDNADPALCDIILSAMEKLDAIRRSAVLKELNDTQLVNMNQLIGNGYVYVAGEITGDTDSVEDYKKKKAEEAAEKARKQVAEEIKEQTAVLEDELNEIKAQRDAAVKQKTSEIRDSWERIIDIETDSSKIPKYREMMNSEIQTASASIQKEYESKISAKESTIYNVKAGEEAKAKKAASDASAAVLKAKQETLENFTPDTELLAAINEAMKKVYNSYLTYSSKILSEGTTVLSSTEYRLLNELTEKAADKSYTSCERVLDKLLCLDGINHGVVRDEAQEKAFIEEELLKEAQKNYKVSLEAGTGSQYKSLSSTASAATKTQVLQDQLSETEIKRNELQFILQAYMDRMTPEEAKEMLAERMEDTEEYRTIIKGDAFKDYAEFSVDSYYDWLVKTLETLEGSLNNSTLESLRIKKDKLQTELLTALDQNLPARAKEIENEIKSIDMEMEKIEARLNAVINSETSTEAEKAIARAGLDSESVLANILKLKEEALNGLKNQKFDQVKIALDGMQALVLLQPEEVMDALKEIYQELARQELLGQDSEELSILAEKAEEIAAEGLSGAYSRYSENELTTLITAFVRENFAISEIQETKKQDIRKETAVPSVTQKKDSVSANHSISANETEMTADAENTEIANGSGSLYEIMEQLNQEQTAVILAGLSMYAQQNTQGEIDEFLVSYCKTAFHASNRYIFEQLKDAKQEFIPLDKAAQVAGFRYIFNDTRKSVVLEKNNQYLLFEAFSNIVKKGKNVQQMTSAAGFQNVIYIPADDGNDLFHLSVHNLKDTSYGVILTDEMQQQAAVFMEYLQNAREGV